MFYGEARYSTPSCLSLALLLYGDMPGLVILTLVRHEPLRVGRLALVITEDAARKLGRYLSPGFKSLSPKTESLSPNFGR